MRHPFCWVALVALCTLAFVTVEVSASAARAFDEGLVSTNTGAMRGEVATDYRLFKGIPFAEPPVADLRLAPPVPKKPWSGILNATTYGPACPQRCTLPPHFCPVAMSEDCLFLNVWTPRVQAIKDAGGLLPVMLWIHGGRFIQGEGSGMTYNGEWLASQHNVIVVTMNYRLGALGFFASEGAEGGFGISDQRVCMQWVRDNIGAFGGDPGQVTLFGESAGASSVLVHVVSQLSKGYFSRAILESNPFTLPFKSVPQARSMSKTFSTADALDCGWDDNTMSCLRSKDINQILDAQDATLDTLTWRYPLLTGLPWAPISGTLDLPDQPWKLIMKNEHTNIPLLMGSTTEEAWAFVFQAVEEKIGRAKFLAAMVYLFGLSSFKVINQYSGHILDSDDLRPLSAEIGTDYLFTCIDRAVSRASTQWNPTYLYRFNHSIDFPGWGPNYTFCVGHACHGVELPFVFHSVKPYFEFSPREEVLSREMGAYWTNFVKSGNPNSPAPVPVVWPRYNATTDEALIFGTPTKLEAGVRRSFCDKWDEIGF